MEQEFALMLHLNESAPIWQNYHADYKHWDSATRQYIVDTPANSGLPNNSVGQLLSDGNGGLWVGTNGGLAHLTANEQWFVYTQDNSDLLGSINSLLNDGSGGLWIGGEGLAHLSADRQWTVYTTDNSILPYNSVTKLLSDGAGGIWMDIPYEDSGIARLTANGEWAVFDTTNSGLPDNHVTALYSENPDSLWIGTDSGGLVNLTFPKPRLANLSGKRAVLLIHPEPIRGHNTHTIGEKISGSIYNSLVNRYYRNDEIYFLAYKPDIDINQDYHADKNAVDAPVTFLQKSQGATPRAITKADIRQAFSWAQNQGVLNQPLLVVIVGHGMNDGNILLNPATNETLSGAELGVMLNDYQQATQNQAIVILESAYSGALLPALQGQNRVIVSSTTTDQAVQYDPNLLGRDAFSTQYFHALRRGGNFHSAFYEAKRNYAQTPQLDDDGDGMFTSRDEQGRVTAQLCLNGCFTPEASQGVYRNGDTIRVTLPPLPVDKDQYVGIALPNGSVFVLSDFNAFSSLGASLPLWQGGDVMFEVPVSADLPRGSYPLFLLRVPHGVNPLENPELWELNVGSLVVE
ncbi:ligand-binding sensor domain-containing protein [Candidatus Venteria ishoeyi]|nr:two-component regulator propeller domain-containing protein [Candidatus Venteria ishoeyi]